MATRATERPKPRLSNLDELFKISENDDSNQSVQVSPAPTNDTFNQDQDTIFTTMSFSLMDDFKDHPFRLYEGERRTDMVDSIKG